MGQNSSNIPQNNIVVWLHLQNYEKITQLIEENLKSPQFNINKPINKVIIFDNQMDDTILHYAAYKKDKKLVQYLIQKGAHSNIKNSRGLTAIDVSDDGDIKQLLKGK